MVTADFLCRFYANKDFSMCVKRMAEVFVGFFFFYVEIPQENF